MYLIHVRWKAFTIRGSMPETWTLDTDSRHLLPQIVIVANMFILFLCIVSFYIVSKSMQNYAINSISYITSWENPHSTFAYMLHIKTEPMQLIHRFSFCSFRLLYWFPNNPLSFFFVLLTIIFHTSAHPAATRSSRSLVNLCPFFFCQFKPMRMFIMASVLTDDTMTISGIKNHARLKHSCHLLASPKFASFVHRLFLLKLGWTTMLLWWDLIYP